MSPFPDYHHEDRPWGSFDQFAKNELSTVKILTVAPGKRFSLQKHAHRTELWHILAGDGTAVIGSEERQVGVGDEMEIPVGTLHRLTAGRDGISVLELSLGTFDENDIERVEDDFGRAPSSA